MQASHTANKTLINCSFQILMIILTTILNYKIFFVNNEEKKRLRHRLHRGWNPDLPRMKRNLKSYATIFADDFTFSTIDLPKSQHFFLNLVISLIKVLL